MLLPSFDFNNPSTFDAVEDTEMRARKVKPSGSIRRRRYKSSGEMKRGNKKKN
jgi:hypothetical protein